MTVILTLSGLLVAGTLLASDRLWARILSGLAFAGGVAALTFDALSWERVAVAWLACLVVVCAASVFGPAISRMGLKLDEHESVLLRGPFSGVPARAFRRLMGAGRWHMIPIGTPLTIEGEPVNDLMVLGGGSADVIVGERTVATLQRGSFIGEMSLLTQGNATATVKPCEDCWVFFIPKRELSQLCEQDSQIDAAIHTVLSRDLVKKLIALRQRNNRPAMA